MWEVLVPQGHLAPQGRADGVKVGRAGSALVLPFIPLEASVPIGVTFASPSLGPQT